MNYTATLRKMLPPRDGLCGTLWDICPRLLLMSLCCRWWTSWWTSSVSSIRCVLLPSRLSTCLRSLWRTSLRDAYVVSHSWWNSWWKYRRSSLQRTVEQLVDIPVPRRGGRSTDLQGFLPGQSSTGVVLVLQETHF